MADKLSWTNKPISKIFGVDSNSNIEPTRNPRPVRFIPRNVGSTDWILKGAILNGNVMIVSKNRRCSDELKNKYFHMKRDFYFQLTGSEPPVGDDSPIFITLDEYETKIRGYRIPIVFDNSCFF